MYSLNRFLYRIRVKVTPGSPLNNSFITMFPCRRIMGMNLCVPLEVFISVLV